MWEMYLAGSETAFRYQHLMVFQIQLTKDQAVLPLTRDYMFDAERELRARVCHPGTTRKRRSSR
jgi:cyclopropane-fatty-acyl-phospholipid synthase